MLKNFFSSIPVVIVMVVAGLFSFQMGWNKIANAAEAKTVLAGPHVVGFSGLLDNTFYQCPINIRGVTPQYRNVNPAWVVSVYDEIEKSNFVGWVQIFPLVSGELRVVLKDAAEPPAPLADWGKGGRTFPLGTTPTAIAKAITDFAG